MLPGLCFPLIRLLAMVHIVEDLDPTLALEVIA